MSKILAKLARGTKALAAGATAAIGAYTTAYVPDHSVDQAELVFIVLTGVGAALAVYNVANAGAKAGPKAGDA